jgi:hypothetical protein
MYMTSHNTDTSILIQRNDIINLPNPKTVYQSITGGLCNQLFRFINGIIRCAMAGKKFIVIDYFLCCLKNGNMCPVSKIINLEEMTKQINEIDLCKHIKLLDRSNININIINAQYGLKSISTIDVTSILKDYHIIHKKLPTMTDMNTFFGSDPCVKIKKKLYLQYTLNNYVDSIEIEENDFTLYSDTLNLDYMTKYIFNKSYLNKYFWYSSQNEVMFNNLFGKIIYTDGFYEIVKSINKKFDISKMNIMHLRMENDSINHFASFNNLRSDIYKQKLYDKYAESLEKYVDKNNPIYILSHDEYRIAGHFKDYHFVYTDRKTKDQLLMEYYGTTGRELCAIIDLLIGLSCRNTFIGCHNLKSRRGSTFSYVIATHAKCKKILFNLGIINDEIIVLDK